MGERWDDQRMDEYVDEAWAAIEVRHRLAVAQGEDPVRAAVKLAIGHTARRFGRRLEDLKAELEGERAGAEWLRQQLAKNDPASRGSIRGR